MNWSSGLLLVPAVVLGALFVAERMGHEETRAAREALETKLAVTVAAQNELLEERAEFDAKYAALKEQYETEVADWDRRLALAELARDKAIASADSADSAKPAAAAQDPGQDLARGIGQTLAKAFNRPELRDRMRQRQMARTARTHAALFRILGLDEADAETLKGLLADRDAAKAGAPFAMLRRLGEGKAVGGAGLLDGENEALAKADAALREFLGDEDYAALARYEETLSQRQAVERVNKQLANDGQQLTEAQSSKLIDLLHETQTAARAVAREEVVQTDDNGNTRINLDFTQIQERRQTQNELVMERVAEEAFLSEEQRAAVAKQLDKQAANPFAGGRSISIGGGDAAIQIEMVTPDIEVIRGE